MKRHLSVLLPLSLLALSPSVAQAQHPDYGRFATARNANGTPRASVRPLLAIMVDFEDQQFAANHTAEFYRKRLAGRDFPNIRDYFSEASGGMFTYQLVGVVGPVRMPNAAGTTANESLRRCIMSLPANQRPRGCDDSARSDQWDRGAVLEALQARTDLFAYDTNKDGFLQPEELSFIFIAAGTGGGGNSRDLGVWSWGPIGKCHPMGTAIGTRSDPAAHDKEICGSASTIDEDTNFSTTAHELMHDIGLGWDLYGPWDGRVGTNQGATIMDATGGLPDARTVLPDAHSRMMLGWSAPRVFSTTEAERCFFIDASNVGGSNPSPNRRPVLVRTPLGQNVYFMLDYRKPDPRRTHYDADVKGNGLFVWGVRMVNGSPEWRDMVVQTARDNNAGLTAQAAADDMPIDQVGSSRPDVITWGANHILETRPAPGSQDRLGGVNFVLAAGRRNTPSASALGAFGSATPFDYYDGLVNLTYAEGQDSGARMIVGAAGGDRVAVRLQRPANGTSTARDDEERACFAATSRYATVNLQGPSCVSLPVLDQKAGLPAVVDTSRGVKIGFTASVDQNDFFTDAELRTALPVGQVIGGGPQAKPSQSVAFTYVASVDREMTLPFTMRGRLGNTWVSRSLAVRFVPETKRGANDGCAFRRAVDLTELGQWQSLLAPRNGGTTESPLPVPPRPLAGKMPPTGIKPLLPLPPGKLVPELQLTGPIMPPPALPPKVLPPKGVPQVAPPTIPKKP